MHFRENWLIFLGEAESILRICGAIENYFQGAQYFFRDLGRSMHNFQGPREHRPPRGSPVENQNDLELDFKLFSLLILVVEALYLMNPTDATLHH